MKRIFLITTLLFFCFSCNNDDDGGKQPSIVGKWYYETGDGNEATGCHKQCSIEFTSNGEWFFEAFIGAPPNCANTESYSGTYTVSNGELTIEFESASTTATFFVSDEMLVYMGNAMFAHGKNISTYDKFPD